MQNQRSAKLSCKLFLQGVGEGPGILIVSSGDDGDGDGKSLSRITNLVMMGLNTISRPTFPRSVSTKGANTPRPTFPALSVLR